MDTTLSTFERDVIEASLDVPVLVDFWAPWCGPCRSLGPMLERLEREYGGRFRLVNVNSDTNPELVESFNLKSMPYAVVFVDGNAVAQFIGAQPEPFVRAFLDRLIPNPAQLEHRYAREALVKGQIAIAEEALRNAIALDPSCDGARLDLAALLLERDDMKGARAQFSVLSERARDQSNYPLVRARLEAAEIAATLPPRSELQHRIEVDSADLQARLDLADWHIARHEYPAALDHLLEIVRRDRNFGEDVARLRMLEVFDMAADRPQLVAEYRGRLSQVLF
ncbi:MAG: tetratricopeptide repeat protein [Pseudomonadota bacterium]|nr:tetratricopeptide repeat protein [Pseudomonadota bacterium]